jgi:hypothetical protein
MSEHKSATSTPTLVVVNAWGCVAKDGDRHLYEFANGFGIYPDKADAQYLCDQHANAYKVVKAGARGAGASQQFEGSNAGPESALVAALNEANNHLFLLRAALPGDPIEQSDFPRSLNLNDRETLAKAARVISAALKQARGDA